MLFGYVVCCLVGGFAACCWFELCFRFVWLLVGLLGVFDSCCLFGVCCLVGYGLHGCDSLLLRWLIVLLYLQRVALLGFGYLDWLWC